jgi:hypothetical protein
MTAFLEMEGWHGARGLTGVIGRPAAELELRLT